MPRPCRRAIVIRSAGWPRASRSPVSASTWDRIVCIRRSRRICSRRSSRCSETICNSGRAMAGCACAIDGSDFRCGPADLVRQMPPGFAAHALVDAFTRPLRRPRADTFAEVVRCRFGRSILDEFYGPYAQKLWGTTRGQSLGRARAAPYRDEGRRIAVASRRATRRWTRPHILVSPSRLRPDRRSGRRAAVDAGATIELQRIDPHRHVARPMGSRWRSTMGEPSSATACCGPHP